MRWQKRRQKAAAIEQTSLASPSDAIVLAIDAALTFTATREIWSGAQVVSLFDMLLCATRHHQETKTTHDAIEGATSLFAHRRLVSSAELRDRLLDLRLTARPAHDDATPAPVVQTAPPYPFVRV